MKLLYKCIAGLLILSVIGLYCPGVSFCDGSKLFAKADKKTITQHEPKIMAAPEQDIPPGKTGQVAKKKTWLWIGLGVVCAGLLGAAGGGGGGDNPSSTGDVSVTW